MSAATLEERTEAFIAHYGVKGMKWGVRNDKGRLDFRSTTVKTASDAKAKVQKEFSERTGTEVTVRSKPGSAVQVVGGNKRKAHTDAVEARVAEQIAKRNTLDALSNKELSNLVTRMNLEQQYRNLAVKEDRRTAGEKFIQSFISSKGTEAVANIGDPAGQKAASQVLGVITKVGQNKAFTNGSVKGDKK